MKDDILNEKISFFVVPVEVMIAHYEESLSTTYIQNINSHKYLGTHKVFPNENKSM